MRHLLLTVVALSVLQFLGTGLAWAGGENCQGITGDELLLQLKLVEGKYRGDAQGTSLCLSMGFIQQLKRTKSTTTSISEEEKASLIKELIAPIDDNLSKMDRVYKPGTSDIEIQKDPEAVKLTSMTGSFTEFYATVDKRGEGADFFQDYSSMFNTLLPLLTDTPLSSGDSPDFDSTKGTLVFLIALPIGDWKDDPSALFPDYTIKMPGCIKDGDCTAKPSTIASLMRAEAGKMWFTSRITMRIKEYYADRALSPMISFSGDRTISIVENPQLLTISLPDGSSFEQRSEILYCILPTKLFDSIPASVNQRLSSNNKDVIVQLMTDLSLSSGELPLFTDDGFQDIQNRLKEIGYAASAVQAVLPPDVSPELSLFGIKVTENSDITPPVEQCSASNPKREADGSVTSVCGAGAASKTGSQGSGKILRNHIGLSGTYLPDQAVVGQFSWTHTLKPTSQITGTIGVESNLIGSGDYHKSFADFGAFHRRVDIDIKGQSEVTAKRNINGVEFNQRDSGGIGIADVEVSRDPEGATVHVSGTIASIKTETAQAIPGVTTSFVATYAELGGTYILDRWRSQRPFLIQLGTQVQFGGTNISGLFAGFKGHGNMHIHIMDGVDGDFTGNGYIWTQSTPLLHVTAISPVIIRGFRQDAFVGNSTWTSQFELWLRFPGTSPTSTGVAQFVRTSLRWAPLFDMGDSWSSTSTTGLLKSAGIGIRFIKGRAALKADWAYGLGNVQSSFRGSKFSISVATLNTF
jgi:hypothetical protein